MLLKLLLVIPSAVEESLTSQEPVTLFFSDITGGLSVMPGKELEILRLRCAPLRMTKEKTPPRPVRDRMDPCLCASRDRSRRRCSVRPMIHLRGSRRCVARDFFETPASDNPTN